MERLLQIGKIAALVGGVAWTVKALVIIVRNAHFQPLEGVLYFAGVGGISSGHSGSPRSSPCGGRARTAGSCSPSSSSVRQW